MGRASFIWSLFERRRKKKTNSQLVHKPYIHTGNPSHGQWSKRDGVFLLFSDWFAPLPSISCSLVCLLNRNTSLSSEQNHKWRRAGIRTLFLLPFHWSQANRTGREKRWNSIELLSSCLSSTSCLFFSLNLLPNRTEATSNEEDREQRGKTLTRLHKRETYQTSNRQIVKTSEGEKKRKESSERKDGPSLRQKVTLTYCLICCSLQKHALLSAKTSPLLSPDEERSMNLLPFYRILINL